MNRATFATGLLASMLLLAPRTSHAHETHPSTVVLDVGTGALDAEMDIPLAPLGLALDLPLAASPTTVLPAHERLLRAYITAHLAATTTSGRPFALTLGRFDVAPRDGFDALVVHASWTPPRGSDTRAFVLHDDVVLHRVVSHRILVSVRRDFRLGRLDGPAEIVGLLHYQRTILALDRSAGSAWRGARAVFALGTRHIAEGTDHLLFLFALLLPAPWIARRRRWAVPRTVRASLGQVLRLVTAFTLGHSLTLALATSGLVRLPTTPVEVLIAVSILVSAAHALRPLFPGREPWIAAAFGLVHGMAFATTLRELGLDTTSLALSLLSFNLGIEAMQLLLVAAVIPWLLLLARSRAAHVVRIGGALFAMVSAVGWVIERALHRATPLSLPADTLARHPFAVYAVLIVAAVGATIHRRLTHRPDRARVAAATSAQVAPLAM